MTKEDINEALTVMQSELLEFACKEQKTKVDFYHFNQNIERLYAWFDEMLEQVHAQSSE